MISKSGQQEQSNGKAVISYREWRPVMRMQNVMLDDEWRILVVIKNKDS